MDTRLVKIGRLLLAVLFIFSGVSKLISLPFFDGLVAELLIGKDYYNYPNALWYTQVLTRVIISAELLLGVAVLQERYLKKIILPVIQFLLVAFTIHLFYEGFRQENGFTDGNCGCFGDVLPMNNLESIIKNVVAMLLGFYVWKQHDNRKMMHFSSWIVSVVLGIVTLLTLWLTIKDYSPSTSPAVEQAPVEEIVFSKPKINPETIKASADSLVKLNDFNGALELINEAQKEDSLLMENYNDYIQRLEEVIAIQKKK